MDSDRSGYSSKRCWPCSLADERMPEPNSDTQEPDISKANNLANELLKVLGEEHPLAKSIQESMGQWKDQENISKSLTALSRNNDFKIGRIEKRIRAEEAELAQSQKVLQAAKLMVENHKQKIAKFQTELEACRCRNDLK